MKHFFRNYFRVLPLAFALLTGCSTEQEIGLNTDSDNGYGKITFSFPVAKTTTTYSPVMPKGNEGYLDASDMTIFMVNGLGVIEEIFDSGNMSSTASSSTQTATISITNVKEITSARTFYFVANKTLAPVPNLSNIKVGDTLSDLLKLTTDDQKTDHIKAIKGLLLTGSVTIQADDLTSLTPAPISVSLKRRVARFDISNNHTDTGITIQEICFTKAQQTALVFADKDSLPKTKGNLKLIDFTDLAVFPNANGGTEESVFYLYPSDSVSIQLKGKSYNGTERFYNIPLPKGGIQANKRYTLKTNGGPYAADFKLEVNDWMDNGDVAVSQSNPIEIVSSSVVEGRSDKWNGTTLRYDVNNSTDTTVIELEVSVLTPNGIDVDVINAPAGYKITASVTPTATLAQTDKGFVYIQTVTITVPEYTMGTALEAQVLIKDLYDNSQYKKVVIAREDYFPTKHLGWAGCNIYYDTDKGHLTFDDVGEIDRANYQGVYFQWGSLWGISPMGNWNDNTVLYPPAGDTVHASATPIFSTWTAIPRIPDVTSYTLATGKDSRDWAYAYQSTDSVAGVGDICKHLTDKGYAPAGKKWRMPTPKEFNMSSYNFDIGIAANSPANAEGTAAFYSGCYIINVSPNVFLSASGFRNSQAKHNIAQNCGFYWASSPNSAGDTSFFLYFYDILVNPTNGSYRTYSFPIRCVVDKYDPM